MRVKGHGSRVKGQGSRVRAVSTGVPYTHTHTRTRTHTHTYILPFRLAAQFAVLRRNGRRADGSGAHGAFADLPWILRMECAHARITSLPWLRCLRMCARSPHCLLDRVLQGKWSDGDSSWTNQLRQLMNFDNNSDVSDVSVEPPFAPRLARLRSHPALTHNPSPSHLLDNPSPSHLLDALVGRPPASRSPMP